MRAEHIISAAKPEQFPAEGPPEIAFLGRSNVGKSTLLNALVGGARLAFTSSKPGCTRLINFYRVEGEFHFVDLPGYGFARVPEKQRAGWRDLVEAYLRGRKSLALCLMLLDARRGWMETDLELKRWLEFHRRRFLVIATKTDKLKTRQGTQEGLAVVAAQSPPEGLIAFSAVTGQGAREIWQAIRKTRTQ